MNLSFFKKFLVVLFFIQSIAVFSQDSKALANAYLAKAKQSFSQKDNLNTEKYLNKSIQYFGKTKSKELSLLATKFYLVNKNYSKAKKHAEVYFKIEKDINSREYNEMLISFIEIEDNIESGEVVQEKIVTVKELEKDSVTVVEAKKNINKKVKSTGKVGKTLRETYLLSKKYFEQKKYELAKQNLDKFFSLKPKEGTKFYKEMQEVKSKIVAESEEETVIESTETDEEEAVEVEEIEELDESEEIVADVPFAIIEEVPVFPGCEGTRKEKADCLNNKIKITVLRNFNSDLPAELGLSPGKKKIWISFRINEKGRVVDVHARAPHPRLKKEAIRIVKLLPQMQPGKQRGKVVGMKYTLPLSFNVDRSSENQDN